MIPKEFECTETVDNLAESNLFVMDYCTDCTSFFESGSRADVNAAIQNSNYSWNAWFMQDPGCRLEPCGLSHDEAQKRLQQAPCIAMP